MDRETDVSIFVITDGRQCVPCQEYDRDDDGEGMFIMLTNDALNGEFGDDNSICIYKKWKEISFLTRQRLDDSIRYSNNDGNDYMACQWQYCPGMIPDTVFSPENNLDRHVMIGYLDGHRVNNDIITNATRVMKNKTLDEYIPAVMSAYHSEVEFGGVVHHGYLPMIGQLIYISSNIIRVNDALKAMDEKSNTFWTCGYTFLYKGWWSCLQADDERVWILVNDTIGVLYRYGQLRRVLPLFTI